MLFRRKTRNRIILIIVVGILFVLFRGISATTKDDFRCNYKFIYAICVPKRADAKMPSFMEVFKEGIKF